MRVTKAELEQKLQQKIDQLDAMREISRAIASARDLNSTLDLITRRTTEVMNAQSCSIYLFNREKTQLILAASTGLKMDGISRIVLPAGAGLTGWAAQHAETIAVRNAKADPRFYRVIGSGESKFASLMAMPLRANGVAIGAVNIQTIQFHTFAPDEIELFSFIVDLAATAIEKAKSVHAAAVQEIHHRVKNNLQTIAMLLRLQLSQDTPLSPTDILHETINRILSIATVHEILAHERHTSVGIKTLMEQLAEHIARSMTINGEIDILIAGDDFPLPSKAATNLALTVNELLQNSLEHGLNARKDANIEIKVMRKSHQLRLSISDNGSGLPADFSLLKHHGLGLELVSTMVEEDLGGKFTLENKTDGGTLATISIPMIILEAMKAHD